jgi:hypothetical protein
MIIAVATRYVANPGAALAVGPPEYRSAEDGDDSQPRPDTELLIAFVPFPYVLGTFRSVLDSDRTATAGWAAADAGSRVDRPDLDVVICGHAFTSLRRQGYMADVRPIPGATYGIIGTRCDP